MAITLDTIVNKVFKVVKNGYDNNEVESFLDEILEEMENREAETNKLKEQVAQLTAELNQARADLQAAKSAQPAVVTAAPTPTPEPDNGLPKVNTGSWELTLVNARNSIGEAVPEDLAELEGGRYFDARAVDALKEFIAGARAEGLSVCLSSAYRSYNEQVYLFNRKVSQCGGDEAAAARIVNRPGTSEHQLGLCADITDKFYEVKTRDLEKTALYQWMYAHCQDYGFILRYPADKQDITGVMYEPWHFRYVGKEAAAYIMGNGLCLEEFLDLYK